MSPDLPPPLVCPKCSRSNVAYFLNPETNAPVSNKHGHSLFECRDCRYTFAASENLFGQYRADEQGILITYDRYCQSCHNSLKGQRVGGMCPHCGAEIGEKAEVPDHATFKPLEGIPWWCGLFAAAPAVFGILFWKRNLGRGLVAIAMAAMFAMLGINAIRRRVALHTSRYGPSTIYEGRSAVAEGWFMLIPAAFMLIFAALIFLGKFHAR